MTTTTSGEFIHTDPDEIIEIWDPANDLDDMYHPFDFATPGLAYVWDPTLEILWDTHVVGEQEHVSYADVNFGQTADYLLALEDVVQTYRIDREFFLYWTLKEFHLKSKPIFADPVTGKVPLTTSIPYPSDFAWGGALAAFAAYFTGNAAVPEIFARMWKTEFAKATYRPHDRNVIWEGFMRLYNDPQLPVHMKSFFEEYALQLKVFLYASDNLITEEGLDRTE